jgi:flagellar basal-body rod modification protein FlgD
MITGVNSAGFGSAPVGGNASRTLGKDAFLNLLVTQMRHQNPLDPMKDGEFIGQLSQFSTLEGIQQLNASMSEMLLLQQMAQGANLIGKNVVYNRPDSTILGRGIVEAVKVDGGKLHLLVDGKNVSLTQVRGIAQGGQ